MSPERGAKTMAECYGWIALGLEQWFSTLTARQNYLETSKNCQGLGSVPVLDHEIRSSGGVGIFSELPM